MTSAESTQPSGTMSQSNLNERDVSRPLKRTKMSNNEIVNEYETYRKRLKQEGHLAYKGEASSTLINNLKELQQIYSIVQKNSNLSVHFSDAQALNDTANFAAINAKNLKMDDLGLSLNCDDFLSSMKSYLLNVPGTSLDDDADGDNTDLKVKKLEANSRSEVFSDSEDETNNGIGNNTADNGGDDEDDDNNDNSYYEQKFNSFSWLRLGLLFYKSSNKPVPMEFLNGPLETEKKASTRTRIIDDTKGLTLSTAQQVQTDDMEVDTQNTSSLVRSVFTTVRRKQTENPEPVNFFKFFIDPQSFSQSVENLFFTSFLIRDARLELTVNDSGIPMISKVDVERTHQILNNDKAAKAATTHHISSFDHETWQALVEKFDITESYLGHRTVEEDLVEIPEMELEAGEDEEYNEQENHTKYEETLTKTQDLDTNSLGSFSDTEA